MAEKRLFKEYKQLLKKPASIINSQIIELSPIDATNSILNWEAIIAKPSRKDSNYYFNGQWKLDISIDREYPRVPPNIKFSSTTPINHPNVSFKTGEICLDILKPDSWSPAWDICHTVVAILLLLDTPEPDSPLNIDSANLFRHDKVAFESIVQYTIWKYGTFYEGDGSESIRVSSGIKKAINNYTEKNKDIKSPKTPILIDTPMKIKVNSSQDKNTKLEVAKTRTKNNDVVNRRSISNIKVIQDVGEEVTKQFIAKVDEIEHSQHKKDSSTDTTSDYNLFGVKKQVANNVNKQVEKLCSQSASPDFSSPDEETFNVQSLDEITDVKQKFLRQVNDKVNEIIKLQEDLKDSKNASGDNTPLNTQIVRQISSVLEASNSE